MNNKVLFVDDDTELLSSFERNLRKTFNITTATSGMKGIEILKEDNQFACIVSDFKMNQLNGVEFLSIAKDIAPNTPRILLTGFADLKNSMDAINRANIYRLLTKPIPIDNLAKIINEALESYRLIELEKEMMDKTLKSTIKMLIDVLSISQPLAIQHSKSMLKVISRTAAKINIKKIWEAEISAMLSNLGAIAIPKNIIDKKLRGEVLDSVSDGMIKSIPETGYKLINNIPHLTRIAKIILNQNIDNLNINELSPDYDVFRIGHILRIVNDYDIKLKRGVNANEIISMFKENSDLYDSATVSALEESISEIKNEEYILRRNRVNNLAGSLAKDKFKDSILDIMISRLEPGMTLASPIKDDRGRIILSKGYELNELIITKIKNLSTQIKLIEPVRIQI
jgi:CheY-like chemotaxis protein